MPMKYRSRIEIISSILRSASSDGGAAKTRMMYSAYISHAQIKDYLRLLLEKELLAYEEETQTYRTTEKGLRFLRVADETERLIGVGMATQGRDKELFPLG
jgi:predicted transcriptional regulator